MGMHFLSQKKIEETEFDRIMEEHKKWLEKHETGKRAELRDVDLSNMDLSGMDFSHANMEGANLMFSKTLSLNIYDSVVVNDAFSDASIDDASYPSMNIFPLSIS